MPAFCTNFENPIIILYVWICYIIIQATTYFSRLFRTTTFTSNRVWRRYTSGCAAGSVFNGFDRIRFYFTKQTPLIHGWSTCCRGIFEKKTKKNTLYQVFISPWFWIETFTFIILGRFFRYWNDSSAYPRPQISNCFYLFREMLANSQSVLHYLRSTNVRESNNLCTTTLKTDK